MIIEWSLTHSTYLCGWEFKIAIAAGQSLTLNISLVTLNHVKKKYGGSVT